MKKSTGIVIAAIGFLTGVFMGFMLSPMKNGMDIGSNSGNTVNNYYDAKEEEVK